MFPEDAARKLKIEPVTAAEAIRRADFLTVHVPLLDETRNMINEDSIATMKPGCRIVNCARGGIIDEAALLAALNSGHIAGAGLDVFESEPPSEHEWALIKHPKCIATPHLGASTEEAQGKVAQEIAQQIVNLFSDKTVSGVVNAPDLTLSQKPELKPWTTLCEKMGSLVAQTLAGQVKRVHVEVAGTAIKAAGSLCSAAALTGLFAALTNERLNLINAPIVAREREIEVSHAVVENSVYTSLVTLTLHAGAHKVVVAGTVFGEHGRVVMMGGHLVEFNPSGYMLIYKNIDKPGARARARPRIGWQVGCGACRRSRLCLTSRPLRSRAPSLSRLPHAGVLSRVAGTMSENGVNIGNATVSSRDADGVVTSIMSLDKKLPPAVLAKVKASADVSEVHLVYLD
jgi:D-3-phosphoglycerate dehydrogenase